MVSTNVRNFSMLIRIRSYISDGARGSVPPFPTARLCIFSILAVLLLGAKASALSLTGEMLGTFVGNPSMPQLPYAFSVMASNSAWKISIRPSVPLTPANSDFLSAPLEVGSDGQDVYFFQPSQIPNVAGTAWIRSGLSPDNLNTALGIIWATFCAGGDPLAKQGEFPAFWHPPISDALNPPRVKAAVVFSQSARYLSHATAFSNVGDMLPSLKGSPKATTELTNMVLSVDAWSVGSAEDAYPTEVTTTIFGADAKTLKANPGIVWRIGSVKLASNAAEDFVPELKGLASLTDYRSNVVKRAGAPLRYIVTNSWPGERSRFIADQVTLEKDMRVARKVEAAGTDRFTPRQAFVAALVIILTAAAVIFAVKHKPKHKQ